MITCEPRVGPVLSDWLESLSSYELRAYLAQAHDADVRQTGIKTLRAILRAELWHRESQSTGEDEDCPLLERQAS